MSRVDIITYLWMFSLLTIMMLLFLLCLCWFWLCHSNSIIPSCSISILLLSASSTAVENASSKLIRVAFVVASFLVMVDMFLSSRSRSRSCSRSRSRSLSLSLFLSFAISLFSFLAIYPSFSRILCFYDLSYLSVPLFFSLTSLSLSLSLFCLHNNLKNNNIIMNAIYLSILSVAIFLNHSCIYLLFYFYTTSWPQFLQTFVFNFLSSQLLLFLTVSPFVCINIYNK